MANPTVIGRPAGRRTPEAGFTYVVAMLLVAAVGLALAAQLEVWSQSRQREQEAELLWIGKQYREAIGLYYQRSPGAAKIFPARLEDLLEDRRSAAPQRYLRRLYADPFTGRRDWGLVRAIDGRIMGIHSLSEKQPIKTGGFDRDAEGFAGATRYAQWQFVYRP